MMEKYSLYPKWVETVKRIKQINLNPNAPVWVSLLLGNRNPVLDIRLWIKNRPTHCGLYLTYKSALDLNYLLNDYLTGKDMTEPEESDKVSE